MGGHQCGNSAQADSEFCHLHVPGQREVQDPTGPATTPPRVRIVTHVTHVTTMTWEPGEGPVVKLPYRSDFGFITRATGKALGDHDPVTFSVAGVIRRKDGSVGRQSWDSSWMTAAELLPPEVAAEIETTIEAQRNA